MNQLLQETTTTWPAKSRVLPAWATAVATREVVGTVASRVIVVLAGFVASVVTARFLRPEGRGEYFFVMTVAQTLAQFANLGLTSSNTFFVARDRRLLGSLLANSFWVALVAGAGGAALTVGLLAGTAGFRSALFWNLWFVAALAPATLFYMLGTNLFVGIKEIRKFNRFQVGSNLTVLFFMLCAGALGLGPRGFIAASAWAWSLSAVGVLIALTRLSGEGLGFRPDVFRAGLRYAAKAYLATAFGFLVLRSNVFLLEGLISTRELGQYSVASQIADLLGILPQSIALVLFPDLVGQDRRRWAKTLKNLAGVGAILGPACVTVAVLAEPFIRMVFGPEFLPAAGMLRYLLPGVLCLGLTAVVSQYLAASGFPGSVVVVWLAGVLMATALGRLLIPVHAGAGAAIALSITHALIFVGILKLAWSKHKQAGNHD